jgi:hypothetical protein
MWSTTIHWTRKRKRYGLAGIPIRRWHSSRLLAPGAATGGRHHRSPELIIPTISLIHTLITILLLLPHLRPDLIISTISLIRPVAIPSQIPLDIVGLSADRQIITVMVFRQHTNMLIRHLDILRDIKPPRRRTLLLVLTAAPLVLPASSPPTSSGLILPRPEQSAHIFSLSRLMAAIIPMTSIFACIVD